MGGEETKNNKKGKDFGPEKIDNFTNEELKETLEKVYLVIRPLKDYGLVKSTDYIPPLNIIKAISKGINGNQGISTKPYHWGLVFETKNNKWISCQYPPITIKKAFNLEEGLKHILDGVNRNKIKDLEKTKRKYGGLGIKKEITIEGLIELGKNVIKKKYTAIKDNCQKFCCDILASICLKNINEIRISGNYCLFTDEEEKILNKKKFKDYLEKTEYEIQTIIDEFPHEEWNEQTLEDAQNEMFHGIIKIKQLFIEETLKGSNEKDIFEKVNSLKDDIISRMEEYDCDPPSSLSPNYSNSEEREDWDSFDYDQH